MTSNTPDNYEDDFSEFEVESQAPPPPDTDAESSRDGEARGDDGAEEGLLDQVLTSTDRLCCARGKEKSDDIESGNPGEGNLVPEAPATENGDNVVAELDPSAPNALTRDPSVVKESVEIKAHFDKDEDGVTIISENGLDNTGGSEKIGSFVSEDEQAARRRRLQFILAGIAALIFIIGLSSGLARRNKKQQSTVVQSATISSSTGSGNTDNSSAQNMSEPEEDESTEIEPTNSTEVFIPTTPTTDAPVNDTTVVDPPVESPVECVDSLSVDASCYEFFNDEILATFNICDPVSLDWVALYPEGSSMTNLPYPQLAWQYSCGDQACTGSVQQGTVSLGFRTEAGRYQAYLFSNAGGDQGAPYSAIASSEPFEITVGTCD